MAAAQTINAQLNFSVNFSQTQTVGLVTSSSLSALINQAVQYVNGNASAALNVDQLYAAQLTIASTTTTVHFQTSTAHDLFANTLAMLRIRELIIQNTTLTSGFDLTVEASASNGVTWLPVAANTPPLCYAGGLLRFSDPQSSGAAGQVISSTTDGISFVSASHTVVINVVALGCSVA